MRDRTNSLLLQAGTFDFFFSAVSQGFVCAGITSTDNPFSITGHTGKAVDVWCAYGTTLVDNLMQGTFIAGAVGSGSGIQIVPNAVSKLTNVMVTNADGVISASFSRTIVAPTADDLPFAADGSPQIFAWALNPDAAHSCDGCEMHPPTLSFFTQNEDSTVIAWSDPFACPRIAQPPCGTIGKSYSNCVSLESDIGLVAMWNINSDNTVDFFFSGQSAGYLCVGLTTASNGFSLSGHGSGEGARVVRNARALT
jgi:hypothetical protein